MAQERYQQCERQHREVLVDAGIGEHVIHGGMFLVRDAITRSWYARLAKFWHVRDKLGPAARQIGLKYVADTKRKILDLLAV